MPSEAPLSVVVVGYGFGGRVFHAPLVAATSGLSLDAIVTSDPERREQARRDHPSAVLYDTVEQAWEGGHDIAAISTANVTHVPFASTALASGLHVVLDKPLAATADEVALLAQRATAADRLLMPFQNRRWDSDILTALAVTATDRLGAIHRFESRITKMRVVPKAGWRGSTTPEDMGGMLYDLGIHVVDQALMLMGPVVAVACWARTVRPGDLTDDDTTIILTHISGAISILTVGQAQAFVEPRMVVYGTRGGLWIDPADDQESDMLAGLSPASPVWGQRRSGTDAYIRTFDDDSVMTEVLVPLERGAWPQYYRMVEQAVRGLGPVPVTMHDAIADARVLDAARVAAATGMTITLDPPAAHGN